MKYELSKQEVADLHFLYGLLMGESSEQFQAVYLRFEKMVQRINKEQMTEGGNSNETL